MSKTIPNFAADDIAKAVRSAPAAKSESVCASADARDAADAGGHRRADGPRVIHGTTHVGAGVDARDHQVERVAQRPEPGEHHAQRRRTRDRPGLVDPLDVGSMHLGLDHVQRTEGSGRAAVLVVGCTDDHVTEGNHRPGEDVEPHRIDAVVVRHQDAHPGTLPSADERQVSSS